MPLGMNELLGILVLGLVVFVILKVVKLTIRVAFFLIGLLLVVGLVYYVFVR